MLKKILVLDDNEDILEVVHAVLSYENYNVHVTSNSGDIIHIVKTYKPDLIILDYKLSDANGGEICQLIKADSTLKQIPVIIFSAYIHKDVNFSSYGCDGVIAKPFDLTELTGKVNSLLEASSSA
jgi:DNA-binding response OmpR family regulator